MRPEFMRRINAPPVPRAQAPAAEVAPPPPPPRAQAFSPGLAVDAAAAAFGPQYVEAARNGGPEEVPRGRSSMGETIEGLRRRPVRRRRRRRALPDGGEAPDAREPAARDA